MKKFQLIVLFNFPSFAFSQIEKKTKIYFKVKAACSRIVQFARNDKPFRQPVQTAPKSFMLFVHKQTNGVLLHAEKAIPGILN